MSAKSCEVRGPLVANLESHHRLTDLFPAVLDVVAAGRARPAMFRSKLASHAMYKELTVRNSNTVSRLAKLLAEM